MTCLITLLIVLLALGLDFAFTSGVYWVVCWAFGFTFTWPIAIAIWLITIVLASIFKSSKD